MTATAAEAEAEAGVATVTTVRQGLTLVHFLAERKRFLWVRGGIQGCSGGVSYASWGFGNHLGCIFVSETAQVELKSGRV
jgi:hypothetical protein